MESVAFVGAGCGMVGGTLRLSFKISLEILQYGISKQAENTIAAM